MKRETLVALRKERGWSQKDVVTELQKRYGIDITASYYGMIESGVRTPRLRLAMAIADLFGNSIEEIFTQDKPHQNVV